MSSINDEAAALRDFATRIGLTKLSENHFGDLERAWQTAQTITRNMPRDLSPADEPAHIYLAGSRQVSG